MATSHKHWKVSIKTVYFISLYFVVYFHWSIYTNLLDSSRNSCCTLAIQAKDIRCRILLSMVCTINCKIQSLGGGRGSCWIELAYIYLIVFGFLGFIIYCFHMHAIHSCTPPPLNHSIPYMDENTISVACSPSLLPKPLGEDRDLRVSLVSFLHKSKD